MSEYLKFLENKRHSIGEFGFDANYTPNIAFDFQKFIIEKAVKKMLAKTETKRLIKRLKIYNKTNHPHDAQNPIKINLDAIIRL
jgi:ribosomal protein L13